MGRIAGLSMPKQKMIPCLFMRGAYFLKEHLANDRETLDKLLLAEMGSSDPLQINGLGGGTTTTSKVAIMALSDVPGVDIDYHFAQVSVVGTPVTDWGPLCGNILAGVGPAVLEICNVGRSKVTKIRIRLLNTGSVVDAVVQTPGRHVLEFYDHHNHGILLECNLKTEN